MDAAERDALADMLEPELKPYRDDYQRYSTLPHEGQDRDDILAEMRVIRDREESRWADGFASGAVYHGDPSHITFMNDVYALNSQANPLHSDLWPSADEVRGGDRRDGRRHAPRRRGASGRARRRAARCRPGGPSRSCSP